MIYVQDIFPYLSWKFLLSSTFQTLYTAALYAQSSPLALYLLTYVQYSINIFIYLLSLLLSLMAVYSIIPIGIIY